MNRSIWWPLPLSVTILVLAVIVWFHPPAGASRVADLGDFLSGVAGALAFVWLIAGFQQQRHELAAQAEDLKATKQALAAQTAELRRMAKYAALGQIASMLESFKSSLAARGVPGNSAMEDLTQYFVNSIAHWKYVLENKNPQTVFDNYMHWVKVEGLTDSFLTTVAFAARLYADVSDDVTFVAKEDPAEFVVTNYNALLRVPHLAQYMGVAKVLADSMVILAPGREKVRVLGLKATNELMPGVINEDAMVQKIQEKAKQAGA